MAEEKKQKKEKKKRKPRPERSLEFRIFPDEDVAHRINMFHAALWELPPVDLDDYDEVMDRTMLYFQMCDEYNVKALLESYAYALGYSRQLLYYIVSGRIKHPNTRDIIIRAYRRLESDIATLSASGQVNPVTAIFNQKNNYGYVDKVEIATTQADPLGEQKSITEIKQRLLESIPQEDVVEAEFTEVKELVPVEA